MIARLTGIVAEKYAPGALIDVNGVGYEVLIPMTSFYRLPELNEGVSLHIHHAISESSQQLFGFTTKEDREFFRILIKVNGVGPKMAVGIMSIDVGEIVGYIKDNNVTAMTKIPGVGKKTAERLVVDLRDKVTDWSNTGSPESAARSSQVGEGNNNSSGKNAIREAESALVALGYKPTEAAKAIARIEDSESLASEQLIRLALKSMLPA